MTIGSILILSSVALCILFPIYVGYQIYKEQNQTDIYIKKWRNKNSWYVIEDNYKSCVLGIVTNDDEEKHLIEKYRKFKGYNK